MNLKIQKNSKNLEIPRKSNRTRKYSRYYEKIRGNPKDSERIPVFLREFENCSRESDKIQKDTKKVLNNVRDSDQILERSERIRKNLRF